MYSTTTSSHKFRICFEPDKKRTKFLRARRDTCTNVNLMPISVQKLLYKHPGCIKLVPSSKDGISTYTAEKINVLGSCDLFVVHPDTKCLREVTFQVVNHEGSVIASCVTSIDLGLIRPHSELNASVPYCGRLILVVLIIQTSTTIRRLSQVPV